MSAARYVAALCLCLALAGPATAGQAAQPFDFGGPFQLVDHDGKPRSDQDFRGRFLLVFFGYTNCITICPIDLDVMGLALDELGPKADKVQPLFISVDPKRDTPAVLKAFIAQFHPRLVGLTGTSKQVAAVVRAYKVHRAKFVEEDAGAGDYLVSHSGNMYLMGPDGKFVTLLPHGSSPEFINRTLATYLN